MVWNFNSTAGTITTNTTNMISEELVNDNNSYTSITVVTTNIPTDWDSDIDLYIVDASGNEYLVDWNGTIEITSSTSLRYLMKNTTSSQVYDMFDQYGKPMIMRISYA